MPKFCPTCGKPLQFGNAEICPNCGDRIQRQPAPIKGEKSPWIAALLSFLPGLGQVYNGDLKRGTFFLLATLVGFLLFIIPGIIFWGYQIYDAHSSAKKMNAGKIPYKEEKITDFIIYVAILFIAILIFVFIYIFEAAMFSYIITGAGLYHPG